MIYIVFLLVGINYKKSASWGSPKLMKSNERRKKKKERKSVLTNASYTCERHNGWRTQAAWANYYLHGNAWTGHSFRVRWTKLHLYVYFPAD